MKKPKFMKLVMPDGLIGGLNIFSDKNAVIHSLMPDLARIAEKELSPLVLKMISNAYAAGFEDGVNECVDAGRRVIFERSIPSPTAKISDVIDYRIKDQS